MNTVKQERLRNNLTQKELAKMAGVSERTVRRAELRPHMVSVETVDKILKSMEEGVVPITDRTDWPAVVWLGFIGLLVLIVAGTLVLGFPG